VRTETLLIERIRAGEADAWDELIGRFEGRLLAFVEARLSDRSTSEDVVQETFVGFLISLPNYDTRRGLENYLFSIAAHKLTDHYRRSGRRPAVALDAGDESSSGPQIASPDRRASAMVRSAERQQLEEDALRAALEAILSDWCQKEQWQKVACVELLLVRGATNKDVAGTLGISEQAVANQKFEFLERLRGAIGRQRLSPDVFPELAEK
jgi:RNA polymerase sigma-70 factor (ECF subfamily)